MIYPGITLHMFLLDLTSHSKPSTWGFKTLRPIGTNSYTKQVTTMELILPDILQTNKMMIMAEVTRLVNVDIFLTSGWHSLPQQVSSLPLIAIPRVF